MGTVSSTSPGKAPRHRSNAAKPGAEPEPVVVLPEGEHHHGHADPVAPEVPTDPEYRQGHVAHE